MRYRDDFTYYYFDQEELRSAPSAMSVPEYVEDFANIHDAVGYVQKLGCLGQSQHVVKNEFHQLCLKVLKVAVNQYGETFPVLLRGTQSDRPDSDHKILFGTTNTKVAAFYGDIREYRNVRGLRTRSIAESVVSDGLEEMDEEIIFFSAER